MKKIRNLHVLFLVFAFATVSFSWNAGNVLGAQKGGLITKEKDVKPQDKGGLIVVEIDKDAPPPPPPPPSVARLALATNAVEAEVLVNNKLYGKTKPNGTILVDTRIAKANITIRHPDFTEFTKSYALKLGGVVLDPVDLVSKYGQVTLGGIPEKAQILIDGKEISLNSAKPAGEVEGIKKEEGTIFRVDVGPRKVKIVHPDYIAWEGDLDVTPFTASPTFITPPLKLATAKVTIESLTGAKVYLDGVEKNEVPKSGSVVIDEISMRKQKPEGYEIIVNKVGYLQKKITQKLNIGDNGTLKVLLNPIPNSAQFNEFFKSGLGNWIHPESWKIANVDNGTWLVVNGPPNLGFPKDANYRNFDGQFTFKMTNGKGIAWALRIQGEKNDDYYLFYLSGPTGKYPNQFRTYVSKGGKLDLDKPVITPADVFALTLTNTDLYTIRIEARGNKISHYIKPETPGTKVFNEYVKFIKQFPGKTDIPLGDFKDDNEGFYTFGGIGFRTIDGEEMMIKSLSVQPIDDAKADNSDVERRLKKANNEVEQKLLEMIEALGEQIDSLKEAKKLAERAGRPSEEVNGIAKEIDDLSKNAESLIKTLEAQKKPIVEKARNIELRLHDSLKPSEGIAKAR